MACGTEIKVNFCIRIYYNHSSIFCQLRERAVIEGDSPIYGLGFDTGAIVVSLLVTISSSRNTFPVELVDSKGFSSLRAIPVSYLPNRPSRFCALIHEGGSGFLYGASGLAAAYVCSRAMRRKCSGVMPRGPRNFPKSEISWSAESFCPTAT